MAGAERAQLQAYAAKLETQTELTEKLTADLMKIEAQNSGYADELASLDAELFVKRCSSVACGKGKHEAR